MGRTWCQGMKNEWQKIRYCRSIQLRSNWPWIHAREAESEQVTDESTTSCRLGAHGFRDTTDARGSDEMRHCWIPKYARVRDRSWELSSRLTGSSLRRALVARAWSHPGWMCKSFSCNPSILHRNGNCGLRLAMVRPDTPPSFRVGGFSGGPL